MTAEKRSEYDGSIYWGSTEELDNKIAFAINKEYEFTGKGRKSCAQYLRPFSLIDRCYALTLAQKECHGLDPDTFELYFHTSMTYDDFELGAEDNLLSIFSDRFTIEKDADPLYDPIIIYSDTKLLDEITFAEGRFVAIFRCRTTDGMEFETEIWVKIKN